MSLWKTNRAWSTSMYWSYLGIEQKKRRVCLILLILNSISWNQLIRARFIRVCKIRVDHKCFSPSDDIRVGSIPFSLLENKNGSGTNPWPLHTHWPKVSFLGLTCPGAGLFWQELVGGQSQGMRWCPRGVDCPGLSIHLWGWATSFTAWTWPGRALRGEHE